MNQGYRRVIARCQSAGNVIAKCQSAGSRGHIAALLIGAVAASSLAPIHLSYISVCSALVLLYLLRTLDWRQSFVRGTCYGFGLYLVATYWIFISVYYYGYSSSIAAFALLFGLSAFMAVHMGLFWGLWAYARVAHAWRYLLLFPACWTLGEWMTTLAGGGFPWVVAGYAHLNTPLSGWAPVLGVFGLSFANSASAGAVYCLVTGRARRAAILTLLLLWGGGAALSRIEWTQETGETMRFAVVQANIPLEEKFDEYYHPRNRALYRRLIEPLWKQVDAIVLPETAIAAITPEGRVFLSALINRARAEKVALISGISERAPQDDGTVRYYNAARSVGAGRGLLRKRQLVPFGEFVPMETLLRGLIPFFDLPLSSFDPGASKQAPLWAKGHALDTFICYEIVYPDLVARHISPSGILLTISEDAWFGDSSAPRQHLHMAQMRALETGREIVRGTNRGISAIIDHRGELLTVSPFMQRHIIMTEAHVRSGTTPFVRLGSLPVLAISGLLLLGGLVWSRPILRARFKTR